MTAAAALRRSPLQTYIWLHLISSRYSLTFTMIFTRNTMAAPRAGSDVPRLEALESKRLSDLPPPYLLPALGTKNVPIIPRVNHLHVSEKYKPIIGAWTVDPLLAIPAVVLETLPSDNKCRNLDLYSRAQKITAHINLVSESPCTSSLAVHSKYGEVEVIIVSISIDLLVSSKASPVGKANKPTIPLIC